MYERREAVRPLWDALAAGRERGVARIVLVYEPDGWLCEGNEEQAVALCLAVLGSCGDCDSAPLSPTG